MYVVNNNLFLYRFVIWKFFVVLLLLVCLVGNWVVYVLVFIFDLVFCLVEIFLLDFLIKLAVIFLIIAILFFN